MGLPKDVEAIVDKLPVYADTGETFVLGVDKAWVVVDCMVRQVMRQKLPGHRIGVKDMKILSAGGDWSCFIMSFTARFWMQWKYQNAHLAG